MKVTRFKVLSLFLTVFLVPAVSPRAFDFGLITNQYLGVGNQGAGDVDFTYQADVLPRFSFLIGDSGELLLSAGLTLGVSNGFYFVPEILQTEFSMRFGGIGIRAGRFPYSDPLSFIADGLFDGVQFSYNSSLGTFSAGAWYTGLLYKKNAKITMNENDQEKYDNAVDFGDFFNTYFAPSRLLLSLDWQHPSIAELLRLRASVTGQADLSKEKEKYHSQYLTLKAALPFNSFLFELGGSIEMAQVVQNDTRFVMAFAWDFGIFWTLPTSFNSRLSLSGHFAGGKASNIIEAFVPITTKYYGNILEAKLPGLSVFDLNYMARINSALGAGLSALYFVRNDLDTFKGYPVINDSGYFLGAEIFGRLIWSPMSDLQLSLGSGMFLPALGNAGPGEKPLWRVELNAVLALY